MKYHQPYGISDPNAGYINGDPSQGIPGSIPPAQSIEYPQREIVNLITKGGYVPTDNDLFQATRAVRRAAFAFATDTGSQNALSIAVDPPITAYEQGTELRVLCAYDNTGPSTIRVNGLPAAQIVRKDGTPLIAGDLRLGGVAVLVYDGANFQLVSGTTGNVTVTGGWFNGADYIVDVGTTNHIIGSPPIPPTAYAAGQGFTILVKNDNTGPVDLNVNALGAKPLKAPGNIELAPGDIKGGMLIRVWFDGTAFKMLSPIWMERIDTALAFVVGPNAGADFADLNAAMFWISRRRIDTLGSVTFNLQGSTSAPALVHTYNVGITIEHPDGNRITISGPAPAFVPAPGNFTSTGYTQAAIDANSNSNVAMLRNAFRAEIRFTTANTLIVRGNLKLLTNVLVTGGTTMGTAPANQNLIGCAGGKMGVNCVAAAISTGCSWYIDIGAEVFGANMYAVGSSFFAIGMSHNSSLIIGDGAFGATTSSFVVAGAYVDGIQATLAAVCQLTCANQPRFYSIGQWCMNHWGASAFHVPHCFALYAAWGLVQCVGAATNYCAQGQISYSNACVVASQAGYVDFSNGYGAAISGYTHNAQHLGGVYGAGFQNTWLTTPARNTFGNGGAMVEG